MLLGFVLKIWAFNIIGKEPFFVCDDSVCFLLNRILTNTDIDFVNNYQLRKYCSETVLLPNFWSFRNSNFGGKWRALNVS